MDRIGRTHGWAFASLVAMALIWGYNWVIVKEALSYAGPFHFAALRTLPAALCLMAWMAFKGKPLRPRAIPQTILLGLFLTAGPIGLSTLALVTGGAGKTAILVYAMPLWVLLLAWPILGERIHGLQWFPVLLALGGLFLILEPWRMAGGGMASKVLAVLAGLSWAISSIMVKVMRKKRDFETLSLTAWQMLFGSIPLVAMALFYPSGPIQWNPFLIGALVYNTLFSGALAAILWFYVLQRLSAGVAGLGSLMTPVIGVVASLIELGERPTLPEAVGMVSILMALLCLFLVGIWQVRRLFRPRGAL